jgi:hypothetical protein
MADYIRPTPRNPVLGLLADALMGGLAYMEDPRRTQQMRGVGGLLSETGIAQTIDRLASGEPLTKGKGFATRMKPETAAAAMTLAPEAVPIGRAAMRAVRATEGLPVGASIRDAGQLAIAREGNPIQGAAVLIGDKIFLGRTHGDALNRAVYEGVVQKQGGKYIYPKGAEVDMDLFMLNDGRVVDRLTAYKELDIGAAETAIEKGLMQNTPGRSMAVDEYMRQAKELKRKQEGLLGD